MLLLLIANQLQLAPLKTPFMKLFMLKNQTRLRRRTTKRNIIKSKSLNLQIALAQVIAKTRRNQKQKINLSQPRRVMLLRISFINLHQIKIKMLHQKTIQKFKLKEFH
tara:strand:+ start:1041 stop:1364 length:324 start_codon:yes stop_codon:yes gene_type:complete